jgi:hypothetical protein
MADGAEVVLFCARAVAGIEAKAIPKMRLQAICSPSPESTRLLLRTRVAEKCDLSRAFTVGDFQFASAEVSDRSPIAIGRRKGDRRQANIHSNRRLRFLRQSGECNCKETAQSHSVVEISHSCG